MGCMWSAGKREGSRVIPCFWLCQLDEGRMNQGPQGHGSSYEQTVYSTNSYWMSIIGRHSAGYWVLRWFQFCSRPWIIQSGAGETDSYNECTTSYIYQEKSHPQVETLELLPTFHTQSLLGQFIIPSLLLIFHNSYKAGIPLFSDHTNDILFCI